MLPPVQGCTMSWTQQFPTAIEHPRCSRCQTRMMLKHVSSGPIGFEHRVFECPECDQDPFKSTAAGWLAGELRAPN